jgi:hypothetical protein
LDGNIISRANAIEQRGILIDTDAKIANKCNFNKATVQGYKVPLREELISCAQAASTTVSS